MHTQPQSIRLNGVEVAIHPAGAEAWHWHIPMDQALGMTEVQGATAAGGTFAFVINGVAAAVEAIG